MIAPTSSHNSTHPVVAAPLRQDDGEAPPAPATDPETSLPPITTQAPAADADTTSICTSTPPTQQLRNSTQQLFERGGLHRTCAGTTTRGTPCQSFALTASSFCLMHDPESADRTRAVRARGGAAAARLRTYRSRARALEHHAHLADFTADVLYDLLDGALDHHAARVLLAGASLQARFIDLRRKEEDEWGASPSADPVSPHRRVARTPRQGTGRAARAWARDLDPQRSGFETEARMLRQLMQEAFTTGNHPAVRHHAEALRRLLDTRAPAPRHDFDPDDPEGESGLEDGLSADLRRVLQRVGVDMGIDA